MEQLRLKQKDNIVSPQRPRIINHNNWRTGRVMAKNSSRPVKSKEDLIGEIIINWFLHESPKADAIRVVKNSIQLISDNLWKAKVQTFIYLKTLEPRIHESYILFHVDKNKSSNGDDYYSIHHNHLIFPSAL